MAGGWPRRGRRGSRRPPVANRIHARAERTATRSTKSVPTPPVIGTPAVVSATCTGAIVALTRVSTATSAGAAPEARRGVDGGHGGGDRIETVVDVPTRVGGRRRGGSADGLGDPPAIVTQQAVGSLDDAGGTAVVDLERVVAGTWEPPIEVDQPARIGAVVPVDRLVVVADAEHRPTPRREQPHQQHVGRREVLELVDEQHPARVLRGSPRLGLCEQHVDGAPDLVVEVDRAGLLEGVAIERPHVVEPVDVASVLSSDHRGVEQPESHRAECVDPRSQRVDVELARGLHEALQQRPHLGLVDRAPATLLRRERRRAVDDRQRDRVQGAHADPVEIDGPRLHLDLGALVEGDEAQRSGRQAPHVAKVAGALGEDACLARPGRGDDARRAAVVHDCGELVGRQLGARCVRQGGVGSSVRELEDVHDFEAIDRPTVPDRPAVEPHAAITGQDHIARLAVSSWSATHRLRGRDGSPRRRRRRSGVDGVGPDHMVQLVTPERVPRPEQVLRAAIALVGQFVELHAQFDDHRLTAVCRPAQIGDGLGGGVDRAGIDTDAPATSPLRRRLGSRKYHDVAGQFARAATGVSSWMRDSGHRRCRRVVTLCDLIVTRLTIGDREQRILARLALGPTTPDIGWTRMLASAVHARDHSLTITTGCAQAVRASRPCPLEEILKIRLCRPSRDPPKFQGCRWHGLRIECYGPMTAEGAATRKHRPVNRSTSRPLQIAWVALALVVGACVANSVRPTPVVEALDNTPWVLPSSPPRCTVQQVDSGNVAGCTVTFYDDPAATGWGIAARPRRGRGLDLERLLVQRVTGTRQLGSDPDRRQQPAGRRPRSGHIADPRRSRGRCSKASSTRSPPTATASAMRAATRSAARAATADGRCPSGDPTDLSNHAWGLAIDMNSSTNPIRSYSSVDGVTACMTPIQTDSAAMGDPDRREVGPVLGRIRMERRLPEHLDPAHRRVTRPTSLRVPWHAATGGRDRRLQPAQQPQRRLSRRSSTMREQRSSSARCRACPAPACGCPCTSIRPTGAVAALINLTATEGTAAGYLTLEDCAARSGARTTSALTYATGTRWPRWRSCRSRRTGRSACIDRRQCTASSTSPRTSATTGEQLWFEPSTPTRLTDTRVDGACEPGLACRPGPLPAQTRHVVPTADGDGRIVNLTVVDSRSPGYLQVGRCADVGPTADFSNLNVGDAGARANMALVPAGDSGTCCLRIERVASDRRRARTTHRRPPATGGSWGRRGGRSTRASARPQWCQGRPGAGAVVRVDLDTDAPVAAIAITVTDTAAAGFVTVGRCADLEGATDVRTSNVNYSRGTTTTGLALVAARRRCDLRLHALGRPHRDRRPGRAHDRSRRSACSRWRPASAHDSREI